MNAPTRASLDAMIIGRASKLLTLMGMSVVVDGTNPLTVDPLTVALSACKINPANFGQVTDGDLSTLSDSKAIGKVVDIAEFRLMSTLQTNFTDVTTRVGTQSEVDWSDILKYLNLTIARLSKELQAKYGFGLASLVPGVIRTRSTTTAPAWDYPIYPFES